MCGNKWRERKRQQEFNSTTDIIGVHMLLTRYSVAEIVKWRGRKDNRSSIQQH